MWIRSQDRCVLMKIHDFIDIQSCSRGYLIRGEGCELGTYSTKEKATVILTDIENHLESPGDLVFQMPRDEDVEV